MRWRIMLSLILRIATPGAPCDVMDPCAPITHRLYKLHSSIYNLLSKTGLFCDVFIALSEVNVYIYIYLFSIWTSPIINIYSDGLGHFQSYRLRNPHMPQYERLGICLATSCLLGMQLCPKVSCFLLILFIFILHACFGLLIGLLTPFSAAWSLFVLFLWAAPSF